MFLTLKKFLRDRILFFTAWCINSLCIILFYYLTTKGNSSILYPITISSFFLGVVFIVDFIYYLSFNNKISKAAENPFYDLSGNTNERKRIISLFKKTHSMYLNEINEKNQENEMRERFLSQWIHNMKTPISVIDLILQKNKAGFKSNVFLKEIEEENNKLLNNMNSTLNFIRLEEFSKDFTPEEVNIQSLVKELINNKKSDFIYNNVFPKVKCDCENTIIFSDKKWTKHMIEQIVSNAVKYSNAVEKSKSVFFDITRVKNDLVLNIKDEGIGIPDYDMNKLFEPFFTGENGRKNKNSTGIGLYMCNLIAEKLNHQVTIKSSVGKGTEFKITFLSKL